MKCEVSIGTPFVEHPQYYRGASVMHEWDEVFVGVGETPYRAVEDALDQAAQNEWEVNEIINDYDDEATPCNECGEECLDNADCELLYHCELYVRRV